MIEIDKQIFEKTPDFKLGYIEFDRAIVIESPESFWENLDIEISRIKEEFKEKPLTDDPCIQGMRKLYKAWGIEPSRYRPSSERLNRRVLKNNNLYRVNNVVDVCNFISLKYKLPIGLYDLGKVSGEIVLRYGKVDERYMGITGIDIGTEGKVALFDDAGPVGSPTTDSERTSITENTTHFIAAFHCAENIEESHLINMMDEYTEVLQEFHNNELDIRSFEILSGKAW